MEAERRIGSDVEEPAGVRDLTNVHVEEVVSGAATALRALSPTTAVITASARARPVIQSMSIRRQLGRYKVWRPLLGIASAARADSSTQAAAIDATLGRSHRGAQRSPPPGRSVPSSSSWTPISLQGPAALPDHPLACSGPN